MLYQFFRPRNPKLLRFSILYFRVQPPAYLHLEGLRSHWGLIDAQSRVAYRLDSVTHAPPCLSLAIRHANQLKFEALQTLKMVKARLLPGPYTFFGYGAFSFMIICYGLANSKAFFFQSKPRRRVLRIGGTPTIYKSSSPLPCHSSINQPSNLTSLHERPGKSYPCTIVLLILFPVLIIPLLSRIPDQSPKISFKPSTITEMPSREYTSSSSNRSGFAHIDTSDAKSSSQGNSSSVSPYILR